VPRKRTGLDMQYQRRPIGETLAKKTAEKDLNIFKILILGRDHRAFGCLHLFVAIFLYFKKIGKIHKTTNVI